MNTLQKISKMAAKLEKLLAFTETYLSTFEFVCVQGVDDSEKLPEICLYDKSQAIETFGALGWKRVAIHPKFFNWMREIDGVRVEIYEAELRECPMKYQPVPEWLALGQTEPEVAQ